MSNPPSDAKTLSLLFAQLDRRIPSRGGETLFHSARRHGVRIVGACGGRGTCGTCIVHVFEGTVERVDTDAATLDVAILDKKWVRACQVRPRSDCTIEVAPRSLAPVARAEAAVGDEREYLPLDPAVSSRDVALPAATLADNLADADRLRRALVLPEATLDLTVARELPLRLREQDWSLRVRLRGNEIIAIAPVGKRTFGLAVDLGTTNAAAFLLNLETGERLAVLGIENPQTAWGADLISRINHAIRDAAAEEELRAAALAAINALAHDLCRAVGADITDVVDVAICGNTAMQHLLLGLPVRQLGRAPFVAAVREGIDAKAREIGIGVSPGAYAHIAPVVGGFVGGDHVSALLATESQWCAQTTSVVMDIGTNTEISLIHKGVIRSASSPSGPALEGGHISCGMRAAIGAIERVELNPNGSIAVHTIGDETPVGVCGSGVLDAVATLRRGGFVNERGRIVDANAYIVEHQSRRAVQLAPGVLFTQDDVRAVQLAKAAIRTAIDLLLDEVGLNAGNIERFIIAGAFGAYVNIDSGIAIGLFPDLPRNRYDQVGNAAGVGVQMILSSSGARRRAAEIAACSRYIELSTRGDFQKRFLRNIGFPAQQTVQRMHP